MMWGSHWWINAQPPVVPVPNSVLLNAEEADRLAEEDAQKQADLLEEIKKAGGLRAWLRIPVEAKKRLLGKGER